MDTRDLEVPSGFEVESAALHPPVHEGLRSGFRGRLDTLKSRGLSKVHDIQCAVSNRTVALRDGAKSQVQSAAGKVQTSMRTSPMKWASIAAGSGFALGMLGRIAQHRAKKRNTMPTLVIVEAGC